jgi:hypothetical protein
MFVLHARKFPSEPSLHTKFLAPRQQSVSTAGDWPAGALVGFQGTHALEQSDGRLEYGMYLQETTAEHDISPMEPGWYRVGVELTREPGEGSYLPAATELRYYEAGDYTIDLHLQPAVTVAGRVLGGEPRALSISDPSGVSVPLRAKLNDGMSYAGDGTLDAVLETNANGEFRLIHVPYGPHTVSVGTRAGLLRG